MLEYDSTFIEDVFNHVYELLSVKEDLYCDRFCCYSGGENICFVDFNFTDYYNITQVPKYEMVIRWTYTTIVFLFGLIGNLIIIHILLSNRLLLKASVNKFILNMCIADLILTITGPILFTIRDTQVFWVLGEAWCHLEGYIQMTVMLGSVYSLTVISLDRMIGVAYPLHKHMNLRQCVIAIVIIWTASMMLAVPFFTYRVYTVREWADLTETICMETGDMVFWWNVTIIVLVWIPTVVMVVCYATIFYKFSSFQREVFGIEHPAVIYKKKRVIQMMFIVVIVFITSWLPLQLFVFARKLFIDENGNLVDERVDLYYNMLSISNYMVYLSPVLDPLVYALMHENFQRAFRITYSRILKKPPKFVLTRGTGNRSFAWSTRTFPSALKVNRANKNSSSDSEDKSRRKTSKKKRQVRIKEESTISSSRKSTSITCNNNLSVNKHSSEYDSDSNNNISSSTNL